MLLQSEAATVGSKTNFTIVSLLKKRIAKKKKTVNYFIIAKKRNEKYDLISVYKNFSIYLKKLKEYELCNMEKKYLICI